MQITADEVGVNNKVTSVEVAFNDTTATLQNLNPGTNYTVRATVFSNGLSRVSTDNMNTSKHCGGCEELLL